jgi:uncharacterized protein YcbK (DUF882 family)
MAKETRKTGRISTLSTPVRKFLATAIISSAFIFGTAAVFDASLVAGGETRTIELYQVHTKESVKITYMQDGRYVPSAMKKLNYFFRDWRRKEVTAVDPKTIDLVWELHQDLNSKRPVHVICGYRSGKTNAFLKRIGRNVAKHSQHTQGKAIDFYFPDVPTKKIRNAALFRKVGGVGYYRSSGGPSGFVHLDSARVRHWGPRISPKEMIAALAEGRKIAGKRLSRPGNTTEEGLSTVAKADSGGSLISRLFSRSKPVDKPAVVDTPPAKATSYTDLNYEGIDDDDMAELSGKLAAEESSPEPQPTPQIAAADAVGLSLLATDNIVDDEPVALGKGYPAPTPRLRPNGVMLIAAADMQIIPASAPPDLGVIRLSKKRVALGITRQSLDDPALAILSEEIADENQMLIEQASLPDDGSAQTIDRNGKSDVATELLSGESRTIPLIQVGLGSRVGTKNFLMNSDSALRRDGAPPLIGVPENSVLPMPKVLDDLPETQTVNRDGKGNMPRITFKLSKLN